MRRAKSRPQGTAEDAIYTAAVGTSGLNPELQQEHDALGSFFVSVGMRIGRQIEAAP